MYNKFFSFCASKNRYREYLLIVEQYTESTQIFNVKCQKCKPDQLSNAVIMCVCVRVYCDRFNSSHQKSNISNVGCDYTYSSLRLLFHLCYIYYIFEYISDVSSIFAKYNNESAICCENGTLEWRHLSDDLSDNLF